MYLRRFITREKMIYDTVRLMKEYDNEQDIKKQEKIQQQMNQVNESISHYQNHSFSFKQTRCIGCGLPLELPVVHFLCGHSYHKACINMEEPHCPKCEVTKKEKVKVDEKHQYYDGTMYYERRWTGNEVFTNKQAEKFIRSGKSYSQRIKVK